MQNSLVEPSPRQGQRFLLRAVSELSAPRVHCWIMQRVHSSNTSPQAPARKDRDPMHENPSVTDLVTRARNGEQHAWDALVERYAPLVWSICRRYRLGRADAEDVGQVVWLNLVNHLDQLSDPAALPGWLATTARHECGRVLRAAGRAPVDEQVLDTENLPDTRTATAEQELLAAERHAALHDAFTRLPPSCQQLLALLISDPPVPYADISNRLGISAGSIGPNRRRCLDRLRRDPVIAALINADAVDAADEKHSQAVAS